jgi:hypothetical protein
MVREGQATYTLCIETAARVHDQHAGFGVYQQYVWELGNSWCCMRHTACQTGKRAQQRAEYAELRN